jgi:hypothetical protein
VQRIHRLKNRTDRQLNLDANNQSPESFGDGRLNPKDQLHYLHRHPAHVGSARGWRGSTYGADRSGNFSVAAVNEIGEPCPAWTRE